MTKIILVEDDDTMRSLLVTLLVWKDLRPILLET
jgi:hypothetical protein